MKRTARGSSDAPSWFWLWIPLTLFLAAYAGLVNPRFARLDSGEMGFIENATVLFLVVAVAAGLMALRGAMAHSKRLAMWIVLIALGSFYFAGEEISWGQHFAGWQTPDAWARLNTQQETNLHNVNGLFDQFPRTLLTLAAVVGGIAVPLLVTTKRLRIDPDRLQGWIWPTFVCIPTCLLALAPKAMGKAAKLVDVDLSSISHTRAGEIKECFLAGFLAVYLLSLYIRLKAKSSIAADASDDLLPFDRAETSEPQSTYREAA